MAGMPGTMREFKRGTLRSGSKRGPKVRDRKQAIAIGMNQERTMKRESRRGSSRY